MHIGMLGHRLRLHSPDDGANPPAAHTTDTPAGPDAQATGGAATGKTFSEDDVERIVRERLERAARKAASDREKAEAAAREQALKDQGEYKTLAEQHEARARDLEQENAALKAEQAQAQADRAALKKYATSLRAGVPDQVAKLLDKLSPAEQIDWLTDYHAEQAKQAEPSGPPARGNAPRVAQAARPASPPAEAERPRRSTVSF